MPAEIIASVFAQDPDEAVRLGSRAGMQGADWVELRIDEWRGEPRELEEAISGIELPVLVTCRTPKDGGRYQGDSRDRIRLLEAAIEAGASGLDLEGWESWSPESGAVRLLVRSMHDLHRVPGDLEAQRDRLLDRGADVAKIVCMAPDLADAGPLVELMASSDPSREPTCAFAMGGASWPTRVLAVMLGANFCYARLAGAEETATGQPTVHDLAQLYGVRSLGPSTMLYGLLGDPALHSAGPWLHNRAVRSLGIQGVYLPFETSRPVEWVRALPRRRLRGLSVTAPHKERMLGVCDELSDAARAARAVNTVVFASQGRIVGDNTDVDGVEQALRRAGCTPHEGGGPAPGGVVLGGGGAARAGALALERLGLRVTILARTLEPVRGFARERGFEVGSLRAEVLAGLSPRVVVHATPLGGAGREDERILPEWTPAPGTFVLDMVYLRGREETRLLRDARAAGATPVSGVDMFVSQAAQQLRSFLAGEPVPDEATLRGYLGLVGAGPALALP